MNNEIMGGIMALVAAFDSGMSKWYANYNSDVDYNGHQYVDLGLPSGTVWSIGDIEECDNPSRIGFDYMWGFTYNTEECSEDFYAEKYGYRPYNKYDLSHYILDEKDDVAHTFMGGDWEMPTAEDVQELFDNTKIASYDAKNETLVLKSIRNGQTIQFTGFGYIFGRETYDNSYVYFWTKEHSTEVKGNAICAKIRDGNWGVVDTNRYYGMHCRGVVHTK